MKEAPIYNLEGKKVGTEKLPEKVFGVEVSPKVISRVVVAMQANERVAIANTKTRGEKRGGGRKPWRQKGTGRARHGSIRSPLWRGGGVTFGPTKERVFSKKVNKKEVKLAFKGFLTQKAAEEKYLLLQMEEIKKPETKTFAKLLAKLPIGKSVLLVLPEQKKNISLSIRNLKNVGSKLAQNLSVRDLYKHQTIVVTKDAHKMLVDHLLPAK